MSDLRKLAEQAMGYLADYTVGESPNASAVNDLIADLDAALAQPDESFCYSHCTWTDHHPDCALAQPKP